MPMKPNTLIAGCLATAVLLTGAAAARAANCESSANYGSTLTQADIDGAVKALPPEAFQGKYGKPVTGKLPKQVFLTNLPAVAQQGTPADPGSPGTCEAQSYGYGLGSYTAARGSDGVVKWDASIPQNATSAAWLYELVQRSSGKACPAGSRSLDYLEQLVSFGAPSRGQVPYQSNCTYLDNVNISPRPSMDRFLVGSYAVIPVSGNGNAVGQIRSHLAAGQAVAFTGAVLCGYAFNPAFEQGVIYKTATVPNSGHGQLLVGYDDRLGKSGAPGALLVQNSFGTSWPPSGSGSAAPAGQAFWSYNSFATTQSMAAVAYPLSAGPGKTRLDPSPYYAPVATISRSYQWTPGGADTSAYLILGHVFSAPVKLTSVTLTEPGGSNLKVTATYGQFISSGYSYLKRSDGKSFLGGTYKLVLKAVATDGTRLSYSGKVKVKKLGRKSALAPVSMQGVAVTGPTGAAVTN